MNKEEKIKFADKFLLNKENKYANYIFKESYFKKTYPEIYDDLSKFDFPSDFKFGQKLWHYIYDDYDFDKRCKCPLHGKLKFLDFRRGYREFCSVHCDEYNKAFIDRCAATRIQNCGSIEESYKIGLAKQRETCLKRYGVENGGKTKESVEKNLNTKLERYGSMEELYRQNKIKSDQTKIEKYGSLDEAYKQSVEKRCETLSHMPEDYYDNISDKVKKTKMERYHNENYNNISKSKETCEDRYGVDNYAKTDEFKKIIRIKNNERTLQLYDEIIDIDEDIYHCRCVDCLCDMCDEKEFYIDLHTFFNRKFYNIDLCTNRTPKQSTHFVSDGEKSLCQFIKSVYSGEILENDRSILSGKELDIYLPDLKLAFEFNGVYWHNEFNKDKFYHQEKSFECMNNGIQLIHIWEDDWNYKTDVVKDIIKSKLGLCDVNIGARQCDVRIVPNKDAIVFLDKYHIQGSVKNGISVGLYHRDELVEILTFGSLRKNMGGKPVDGYYEIYRVCSKGGYNIQGGFSRLLRYLEKNFDPICVITYGNLDYTYGNVYLKTGFIKDKVSLPTYTWVVDGIRRHRSNFMKSKLFECRENPGLTENEVMWGRGCWRCWDAGKIKFVKTY